MYHVYVIVLTTSPPPLRLAEATSGHTDPTPCITSTSLSLRMFLVATTLGFRPVLAKDCKNTTLARIRQLLRTCLGDLLQFLAFLQNNRHAYSSDILKVVQAERFFDVTCLIRSWQFTAYNGNEGYQVLFVLNPLSTCWTVSGTSRLPGRLFSTIAVCFTWRILSKVRYGRSTPS